jgi:hypothetical protein
VLLLRLLVVVAGALLWMSVILTKQQAQIEHLIEETAILSAELRAERAGDRTPRGQGEPKRPTT